MLKKITFGRLKFKQNCCSKQYWKNDIGIIWMSTLRMGMVINEEWKLSYYVSILFFVFCFSFFFVSFSLFILKILNEVYYGLWRFKLWDTIYKQWDPTNSRPRSATFNALARLDLSIYPLICIPSFILYFMLCGFCHHIFTPRHSYMHDCLHA